MSCLLKEAGHIISKKSMIMEKEDVKLGRKDYLFFFETWVKLLVVPVLINIVVAYFFCNIDTNADYSWYAGVWHGLCFIGNLVLLLFDSSRLIIASHSSVAYVVFLLIGVLTSVFVVYIFKEIFITIKNLYIHQASCE